MEFWDNLPEKAYFTKDLKLDAEMRTRFGSALALARAGVFDDWCGSDTGTLALVILLDQFSRNILRDTPQMFSGDDKALGIAKAAIEQGILERLAPNHQSWMVMPFMHSEDLADQDRCVELCRQLGLDDNISFAVDHAEIIRKFGRFPHRNTLLSRQSSADEIAFLESGGFAG